MARRIIVGILWGIALYFTACAITGGVVGFIVAAKATDPTQVASQSRQAAFNVVSSIRVYFLAAAVIISAIGIWKAFLPGMRATK
jgi:hypothetical protein